MTSRIKLFSIFVGRLPEYAYDFVGRIRDIRIVDWELLWYRDVGQLNRVATDALGVPCRKRDGYAFSDLRPMLAEVFPQKVQGYEWWGWCEIDTVIGDLDNILSPLLKEYDAISTFNTAVSGPLMFLRNDVKCNNLFRLGNWESVVQEPDYCNFEEVQRNGDGGLTRILSYSDLRVRWDNRFSLYWEKTPAEPILAECELKDGKLLEVPTGRELLVYHFNHTKQWPLRSSK